LETQYKHVIIFGVRNKLRMNLKDALMQQEHVFIYVDFLKFTVGTEGRMPEGREFDSRWCH